MAEARLARAAVAQFAERPQGTIPGKGAEADDDPHRRQLLHLFEQVGPARVALDRRRLVRRRCTADTGADPAIFEQQSVAAVGRGRLIGEAGGMESSIEPVARAVAGEDAT